MTKAELWADARWRTAHWGRKRGRPWSNADYDLACLMMLYKRSPAEMEAKLKRSWGAITMKLEYRPKKRRLL